MLSTFVIGLREGLEAALIVGIVAAFLKQRGRTDLLRLVWVGVGLAALICLGVGIALHVVSADLPQKQQEGLETVVGVIAVAMVTYMVVWMRRHARELKKQLEGAAGSALESGSGLALVAMAFLAVFREGFETAVFLLAAFNEAANPVTATAGAALGLIVAVGLGYGIYRGGVRINLSKFFRFTGGVLVLVAAGLVVNALHTAHEAGWLNVGQGPTFSLGWLVAPGSVQSSLLTGMLGWQPHPVVIELIGWLLYLIPVGLYVIWPPGRSIPRAVVLRTAATACAVAAVVGGSLTVLMPSVAAAPASQTIALTGSGDVASGTPSADIRTVSSSPAHLVVATSGSIADRTWTLVRTGSRVIDGRSAEVFAMTDVAMPSPTGLASSATVAQLAALGGGRLPIGVTASSEAARVSLRYDTRATLRVAFDVRGARILDVTYARTTNVEATLSIGVTRIASIRPAGYAASPAAITASASAAHARSDQLSRRASLRDFALIAWLVALLAGGVVAATLLRRRTPAVGASAPAVLPTAPARPVAAGPPVAVNSPVAAGSPLLGSAVSDRQRPALARDRTDDRPRNWKSAARG